MSNVTSKAAERFYPLFGETDEVGTVEASAEEAEALPLSLSQVEGQAPQFTYNVSTEDAGTTGILDDEAGIIYSGPSGQTVRIRWSAITATDAAGMEETDKVQIAVYLNSTQVLESVELLSGIEEGTVVFSGDGVVILDEGDVIRIAAAMSGEEADNDIDVSAGVFSII